jgi:hypothetical protein
VNLQRRALLVRSLAAAGLLSVSTPCVYGVPALVVENVTRLYPVKVGRIAVPFTSAEARLGKPAALWRNYEASLDAASLEPRSRASSTYVLQEYFVPVRHFMSFAQQLGQIVRRHEARVLNVSVRHSPADQDAVMAGAREEVFSFVVYFKQDVDAAAMERVGAWTRELIAAALQHEGTYYLPYQRHATRSQFDAAYRRRPCSRRSSPGSIRQAG